MLSESTKSLILQSIESHSLPENYLEAVEHYLVPLANNLAEQCGDGTTLIGVQGSQGSGKSTCSAFLKLIFEHEFGLPSVVMSIDDFYLTKAERSQLAKTHHPLFATRGVPGTHDVALLKTVFESAKQGSGFSVPAFDKSIDDRAEPDEWQAVTTQPSVLILEGWCVGVGPQAEEQLNVHRNELERLEDSDRRWRRAVNQSLSNEYADVFAHLDLLVALQAPSFDCVYGWRLLQEEKMIERLSEQGKDVSGAQTPVQIERFISHYQRLTEHALNTMPANADWLLYLNTDHSFKVLTEGQS